MKKLVIACAAYALCLAHSARGDAPHDQYAPFDVTSTEIFDVKTQLHWHRVPISGVLFADAAARCAALDPAAPYRLPTLKEFLTLIDEDPHEEYLGEGIALRYIDRAAFGFFPDVVFWTKTMDLGSTTPLAVSIDDGLVTPTRPDFAVAVRCVR
jgi:hypothetical protein